MKNFSSRTRGNSPLSYKERKWLKPLLFVLGAFLVLTFAKEAIGNIASIITTPFFFVRHYVTTSSDTVPTFLRSQVELLAQIRNLEDQLEAERGKDALYALLREENEELKDLFQGSSSSPEVLAGVISRPPRTPYDTLILDRGEDDGIVKDAPVYYGKGLALGYVHAVSPHTSLVKLFSSPGIESTVYAFGPDIFTTAHGEGGGVVRISIPQGMHIEAGNLIVLPSLNARVLGAVDHVRSVATEPEQYAYVVLDIPLQSIRTVSVGTQPLTPQAFPEAAGAVEEARVQIFSVPVPDEYRASTTPSADATSTEATTL